MGQAAVKEQAYMAAHVVGAICIFAMGIALKRGGNIFSVYGYGNGALGKVELTAENTLEHSRVERVLALHFSVILAAGENHVEGGAGVIVSNEI